MVVVIGIICILILLGSANNGSVLIVGGIIGAVLANIFVGFGLLSTVMGALMGITFLMYLGIK